MYPTKSQPTTVRSQAQPNKSGALKPALFGALKRVFFGTPGQRRSRALPKALPYFASLLLSLPLLTSCEDPGVVGSTFIDEQGNLSYNSYPIDKMEAVEFDGYAGKLGNIPIGHYLDPVFGDINSIGVIRPAISAFQIDTIDTSVDTLFIQLVLDGTVYGDTLNTARFDVYEITQPWRGKELLYGDEISFDDSSPVASFEVRPAQDTVFFQLSQDWMEKYNESLIASGDDRDSAYVYGLPGLALVPRVRDTQKIVYVKVETDVFTEATNINQTRLIAGDTTGTRRYQALSDWGASVVRGGTYPLPDGSTPAYGTSEQFFEIDFSFTKERLISENLARVELVLFEDAPTLIGSLPEDHVRPPVTRAQIHIVNSGDPGQAIYFESANYVSLKDSKNTFRFNLTPTANAYLFDTLETNRYFLSVQSNNGFLHSTLLHDLNTPGDALKPRIIVTAIQ